MPSVIVHDESDMAETRNDAEEPPRKKGKLESPMMSHASGDDGGW